MGDAELLRNNLLEDLYAQDSLSQEEWNEAGIPPKGTDKCSSSCPTKRHVDEKGGLRYLRKPEDAGPCSSGTGHRLH